MKNERRITVEEVNWVIIIKFIGEVLSFRVYSPGAFACVVFILGQFELAENDCIWVLCFDISGYYGESVAEQEKGAD